MFVFRRRAAQFLTTRGSLNKRVGPPRVTRHGEPCDSYHINFVLRYDKDRKCTRQLIREGGIPDMYSQEIRLRRLN